MVSYKPNEVSSSKGVLSCNDNHVLNGIIRRGDTIVNEFMLYNNSSHAVAIKNVEVSCDCTKFNTSKRVINPRDSVRLTVVIDSKNKNDGEYSIHTILWTDCQLDSYILTSMFVVMSVAVNE